MKKEGRKERRKKGRCTRKKARVGMDGRQVGKMKKDGRKGGRRRRKEARVVGRHTGR